MAYLAGGENIHTFVFSFPKCQFKTNWKCHPVTDGTTMNGLCACRRDSDENDETATLFQDMDELDTVQAERLGVVEGLLRNHLEFVKYSVTPPPARSVVLDIPKFLSVLALAISLEENAEAMAALLIRAALNIAEDSADGDDMTTIDEFLELAIVSYRKDREKGVAFLYTVLGDLIRRDLEGDNSLDSDDQLEISNGGSTALGLGLTVLVGNDLIPVPFRDVLPFFWAPHAQLATNCHTCELAFVGEPPIRTINIGMSDTRVLGVRVFNRHFSCIKDSNIPFVPVSHVWTDSIREANANGAHNDAAATKLISTLLELGIGAEHAYGPEVEFWHDYFSVPQWQSEVKEQLLTRLPAIYHLADEILVHLEDLPAGSVRALVSGVFRRIFGNDLFLEAMRVMPYIRGILGSEWMTRMWVMLEYTQCRAACVMTKGRLIYRVRDYDTQSPTMAGLFARDSFSQALNIVRSHLPSLFRYAPSIATSICDSSPSFRGLGPKPLRVGAPCLGEAMELVASKQCQYSRDRFMALDVLLNGPRTEWLPTAEAVLPGPEAEACAHVWLKALRQGDCTPLLLQPRESIPGSNPSTQPGLPSWVVGHSGLEGVEWGYSSQQTPPDLVPVITDEGVIRATLALAGEIEQICYLDVKISGDFHGLEFALGIIRDVAQTEGMELSPEVLVGGLNRVFPLQDKYYERARQHGQVFSFADLDRRDPEFADRIRGLLGKYDEAGDAGDRLGAWDAIRGISDELGWKLAGDGDGKCHFSPFHPSSHFAISREKRGAKGGDPICKVRCPECRRVTVFRLDLRETGGVGQQVYRIPGLAYELSTKNGVGLVIDKDGRITGRMFFGPPACDCRLLVEVEIH